MSQQEETLEPAVTPRLRLRLNKKTSPLNPALRPQERTRNRRKTQVNPTPRLLPGIPTPPRQKIAKIPLPLNRPLTQAAPRPHPSKTPSPRAAPRHQPLRQVAKKRWHPKPHPALTGRMPPPRQKLPPQAVPTQLQSLKTKLTVNYRLIQLEAQNLPPSRLLHTRQKLFLNRREMGKPIKML